MITRSSAGASGPRRRRPRPAGLHDRATLRALSAATAVLAVAALAGSASAADGIGCASPAIQLPRSPAFVAASLGSPPFVGAVQAGRTVLGVYLTNAGPAASRLRVAAPASAASVQLSQTGVIAAAVAPADGCSLVAWQPSAGGAVQVSGVDRAGRWHEPIGVDLGGSADALHVAANATTLVVEGTSVDYRAPDAHVATTDRSGRHVVAATLAGVVPIVSNIALGDDGTVWISGLDATQGEPFSGPLALARLTPGGRLVRQRAPVKGKVTAVAVAVAGTRRLLVAAAGETIEAFDGVGAYGWSRARVIARVPDTVYSFDVALIRDGTAVVAWTRRDSARSAGSDPTQAVGLAERPAHGAFGRVRDLGPYSVIDGLGLDSRDRAVVAWGTSNGVITGTASGPPSAVVLRVGSDRQRIISGGYTDAAFIACARGGAGGVWVAGRRIRSLDCS